MQFPKMKKADLKDADDAVHRKGFKTFEDYVQELRREAWRWKGDVDGTRSTRVKGVTRKKRKATGATVYEARYCPSMQSMLLKQLGLRLLSVR